MIYPFHRRRLSRALAVEAIYNSELMEKPIKEAFGEIVSLKRSYFESIISEIKNQKVRSKFEDDLNNWDSIVNFSKKIIDSYEQNLEKIENILRQNITGSWEYERVYNLEKAILKTAIAEAISLDTPYKVIISEALKISEYFLSTESLKFINAILDKTIKKLMSEVSNH
ncbi:MAG: hypothetical protein N2504_00775 [candidate division WOR-3 bacterium]|nr:hypothetical protein [candidate division WOR-3 bacterium]MCX7947108.1 hypothetical protein [candidate division WOR-3 bacterium]MDW8149851.1 transcription antitermination factor NusB [candidate division WOR-3 bacterium]